MVKHTQQILLQIAEKDSILAKRLVNNNCCLEYRGAINHKGYGIIKRNKTVQRAHRYIYSIMVGDIPEGMLVLHKCDNPSCVNPNHLFLGTHKDNTQDMISKGRHSSQKVLT